MRPVAPDLGGAPTGEGLANQRSVWARPRRRRHGATTMPPDPTMTALDTPRRNLPDLLDLRHLAADGFIAPTTAAPVTPP